ncbi:MAG TPA: hypothetical protein VFV38_25565 [Ktedonobacteraceae bacterium]|nr:hypothetical protein [Ktedonobacteraceae bacterium]
MGEIDNDQGNTPLLQRVRCAHCCLPLVQIYQGDLLYTLHRNEEEIASQYLLAYSYRSLTDPKPLLCCPRCQTPLSPTMVTVVLPRTVVTEEENAASRASDL